MIKTFCGMLSVVGAEEKKAGVPKSLGELRVVADMGAPNCALKSMPYPAEVSMLRFGPIGPVAKAALW